MQPRYLKQDGQTLVDAMMGIGMLSLLIMTVLQISNVEKNTTTHTQLINDVNQLYVLLSNMISTEPTCRVAFGGHLLATDSSPLVAPPAQVYSAVPLTLYNLNGGVQVPFITPVIQSDGTKQAVATSLFGTLQVNSITITPTPDPAFVPTSAAPFEAELSVVVVPISQTNIPFPKNIRGIFMLIAIDGSKRITSCGPMVNSTTTSGGSAVLVPNCPAYQAPTSMDGVTFVCNWTTCPSTSPNAGTDANGWLTCSP